MVILVGPGAQAAAAVTDMPSGWAKPALERMVKEGIMEGSDGRIYPERTLTRAEFAAMVSRVFVLHKAAAFQCMKRYC